MRFSLTISPENNPWEMKQFKMIFEMLSIDNFLYVISIGSLAVFLVSNKALAGTKHISKLLVWGFLRGFSKTTIETG